MVSVASAALVAWAGWTLFQEAERQTPDKDLGQGGGPNSGNPNRLHNIRYIHQEDGDDDPPSTLH